VAKRPAALIVLRQPRSLQLDFLSVNSWVVEQVIWDDEKTPSTRRMQPSGSDPKGQIRCGSRGSGGGSTGTVQAFAPAALSSLGRRTANPVVVVVPETHLENPSMLNGIAC
jgi:hypothetical protein